MIQKRICERSGDWLETISGVKFFPFDPRPEEINLNDIATGLANCCRFAGQLNEFYSVAEHSVFVSRIVPVKLAFPALMHDATEAYTGDMIRPLKLGLPSFKKIEAEIWKAIASRYDIPVFMDTRIKVADNIALATERRDLKPPSLHRVKVEESEFKPTKARIVPVGPVMAKKLFVKRFLELRPRA